MHTLPKIHLIEGPVGAGKTTFARQLGRKIGAPALNLDAWMVELFRPDRPETHFMEWYAERKGRCISQIWSVSEAILGAGGDVILELGLVQAAARAELYARADLAGYDLHVVLLRAHRDTRRRRVQQRNEEQGETFAMEVPDAVFELASDLWEEPDEDEIEARQIEIVYTERG